MPVWLRAGPDADLGHLPLSLDFRAVSIAEGVRAALAVAVVQSQKGAPDSPPSKMAVDGKSRDGVAAAKTARVADKPPYTLVVNDGGGDTVDPHGQGDSRACDAAAGCGSWPIATSPMTACCGPCAGR